MAKSIDISDLDIYYGDFKAVEGVNMTIRARAVTAFIGPSGCGKSTFLRALNRMHEVIPGARVEGKVMVRRTVTIEEGELLRISTPQGTLVRAEEGYRMLAAESAELSGGRLKIAAGTLYGILDRLSDQGLVADEGQEIVDGRARRSYRLTGAGEAALATEAERLRAAARIVQSRRPAAKASPA